MGQPAGGLAGNDLTLEPWRPLTWGIVMALDSCQSQSKPGKRQKNCPLGKDMMKYNGSGLQITSSSSSSSGVFSFFPAASPAGIAPAVTEAPKMSDFGF